VSQDYLFEGQVPPFWSYPIFYVYLGFEVEEVDRRILVTCFDFYIAINFEVLKRHQLCASHLVILLYPTAYSFYSEISISIYLFIMRIKVESY
jgi:hypothetical protein